MKELYTKEYLQNLLEIITDNLKDLTQWSIYNGDGFLEEITNLQTHYSVLKQIIERFELEGGEENDK